MLDIKNIEYQPSVKEISNYIDMPLFDEHHKYMNDKYQALVKIEYSKDVYAKGWNIKYRKAGKSLCVIYPKEKYFTILIVVSKKEKESVEALLPEFSTTMQEIYHTTKEGMDQRWMMIDVLKKDELYQDILTIIQIRRESK